MQVTSAEILGRDDLTRRGLHKWRTTEKDRALILHDDGFIAHRGHIGTTCRARAQDGCDLRYPARRHVGLIEENAPEVISIREDVILHWQEGSA